MKPKPEIVELNADDLESLLDEIEQKVGEKKVRPLRLLLVSYLTVMRMIESKTTTINKLRRLIFGAKTERSSEVLGREETPDSSADKQEGG